MKISIKNLSEETVNKNIAVSELLRKAKIVASELELSDFLKWIDFELNGYGGEKVPEYRILKGDIRAFNPFRGWIPFVHTDPKTNDALSTRGVNQSVGALEELIKGNKKLSMKYPSELESRLRKSIDFETEINLFIDKSQIVGIVEAVRNTLFDWLIKLDKAGVQGENEEEFSAKEIKVAKEVEPTIKIGNIENFHGNMGDNGTQTENLGTIISPVEGFWAKFFWYVIVALFVVIVGNVFSALILHQFFGI